MKRTHKMTCPLCEQKADFLFDIEEYGQETKACLPCKHSFEVFQAQQHPGVHHNGQVNPTPYDYYHLA